LIVETELNAMTREAIHRSQIGTFTVVGPERDNQWLVRDNDKFNDWGDTRCPSRAYAQAYARWADNFKRGRTFSEFKFN
jgi:hypothetical protein